MTHSKRPSSRALVTGLAIVSALFLVIADAQARPGKGSSTGNRGTRTEAAPPVTNTAPRQSQPISGAQTPRAATPSPTAPAAAAPSRMSGLMGGLAAGLLGAGLFGLLSGSGMFSGLGSIMGVLGLLLQIAIVFFIVRFAIGYFRRRQMQPETAGAPTNFARQPPQPEWSPPQGAAAHPAPAVAPAPAPMPELTLDDADFSAFERLLGEIQDAYGKGDRITLTQRVAPEMANIFNQELSELTRQGLTNRISGVKLLQGDFAEAWREPTAEYATVAMRYAIIDVKVETATGRIVEGDPNTPQEVVENWTFVREPGETDRDWKLSAIQQA